MSLQDPFQDMVDRISTLGWIGWGRLSDLILYTQFLSVSGNFISFCFPIFHPPSIRTQKFRIYLQLISKQVKHLRTGSSCHRKVILLRLHFISFLITFALISPSKHTHIKKIKTIICPIKFQMKEIKTWLLFSAWLFLLESGKWMWHPVSSITFLILLPPLPITWECSVCETSIFKVTRLLWVETIYYFLMQSKGWNSWNNCPPKEPY